MVTENGLYIAANPEMQRVMGYPRSIPIHRGCYPGPDVRSFISGFNENCIPHLVNKISCSNKLHFLHCVSALGAIMYKAPYLAPSQVIKRTLPTSCTNNCSNVI